MKILLSATACAPNKGSEPGVGWNWAVELASLGHEVWVLTRTSNKLRIEEYLKVNPLGKNLHFVYYDLAWWHPKWKKGKKPRFIYLHYILWQMGAYKLARKLHSKIGFDLVHHVTWVSVRLPSFMGNLGIPFIFGPVAGGERAPLRLRSGYSLKAWLMDMARDISNILVRIDPIMNKTFGQAIYIYTTSEQTRSLLPKKYWSKAHVQLAIGLNKNLPRQVDKQFSDSSNPRKIFRILYVGTFRSLKGIHLGLAAFAKLLKNYPDSRLTLIGEGPDEAHLKNIAVQLKITENVDWVPWVDQSELSRFYSGSDVFLFPSLHDSGGMVILEAMSHGLPVVCLDLGGPGIMVNRSCGVVIDSGGRNKTAVVGDIEKALSKLALDSELRDRLGKGAIDRTKEFIWSKTVSRIYKDIIL